MIKYEYLNMNPKGRRVGDCSTRALAKTLSIDYDTALEEQLKQSLKHYYGITDKETIDYVMQDYGYVKVKQPRKSNDKKYTVAELDEILTDKQMQEGVLVKIAHHFTTIKDGTLYDIWNCGYKTVGNYWIYKGK